jgi:putative Mn2+ efflux pump MntP
MTLLSLALTALGLSADCFAVAVSAAVASQTPSRMQILRTAFAFGLAQFVMPLVGWGVGREFVRIVADYDHWVAFGLLSVVGIHMLREAFERDADRVTSGDITRGARLLVLAIATSIDALAIGLSIAFLDAPVLLSAAVIGLVAGAITVMGFALGVKLGQVAGQRARMFGGLILIGIGVKIVLEHTIL